MAIPITKFGQQVLLSVHDAGGGLVFESSELRIDFDVRHIDGWARAKFTIYNMNSETIKKLSNGDNYVTVKTTLHDGEQFLVADRMYLSNAMDEKQVPNTVTSLYCYHNLRKFFLENRVDVQVIRPTLMRMLTAITTAASFKGKVITKHFPQEVLDYLPPRPASRLEGSLISIIEVLGQQFQFNMYTEGANLIFVYKPDVKNVQATDFYSDAGEIQLLTNNMRSNPKIGPATLKVSSNLDPRIKPGTILDASSLMAVGVDLDDESLSVGKDFVAKFSGFSKYQALQVQHKGSNYTNQWITEVVASSPTPGTLMATQNWAQ